MTTKYIQSLGNFLACYHSDLTYIQNFQLYKNGFIRRSHFSEKEVGSIYEFLIEFRVVRNYNQGETEQVLDITSKWINGNDPDNVDGFATQLNYKGLTHGKTATVLASKILFLNNPWAILPLDKWAKATMGLKINTYAGYLKTVDGFADKNKEEIYDCLTSVKSHILVIEKEFKKHLPHLEKIRQNRFVDKLLWTIRGQQ
ncbi:MAG: hypothetical protein ABIN94_07805 [Ferruginibacter sp.]